MYTSKNRNFCSFRYGHYQGLQYAIKALSEKEAGWLR